MLPILLSLLMAVQPFYRRIVQFLLMPPLRVGMIRLEKNVLVTAPFPAKPERLLEEEAVIGGNDVVRRSVRDEDVSMEFRRFLERLMLLQRVEKFRLQPIAEIVRLTLARGFVVHFAADDTDDVVEWMGDRRPERQRLHAAVSRGGQQRYGAA